MHATDTTRSVSTAGHTTRTRVGRGLVLVTAGVLLVAACGSSSTNASTSPAANASGAPAKASKTQASNAQAIVKSAMTQRGNALVDTHGMTLYTLTNNGKAIECAGACASLWPPLTATSATVTGGAGITGLGTTKDANGTQVTHNGLPLYRYSQDMAPGDANGEGLKGFGGTWHVVAASATSAGSPSTTPAAPPSTSSSSGGGGYGY